MPDPEDRKKDGLRPRAMSAESRDVTCLVRRARAAMEAFANVGQETIDEAVTALAWSIYKPENARRLAEFAVETTGLGNVKSKIIKNQRKTFGTLRDLLRVRSTGVIEAIPEKGIVKYAKPVGVVAALTPSTNPIATPVNKAMMAVKGGNAVIVAPSPAGWPATNAAVEAMRAGLAIVRAPIDLVQILAMPVDRDRTQELMRSADLVVCTGSQNNVRAAYCSGTPAIGVGIGNVPVIIDETADILDAAQKIAASKTFDNASSCSSENAVIILDGVFEAAVAALEAEGGYMATPEESRRIVDTLWHEGKLNREVIAKDAAVIAELFELTETAASKRFFMVMEDGFGPEHPLSGEKLSLVLTLYRAADFAHAKALIKGILGYQGRGHSCGIHTQDLNRARALAAEVDVVRVLVNQAHTFGNGGSFENGLPFTLSMGCGTWAGNSISDNLNWRNFINVTHLVLTIPDDKPAEEELFGPYWAKYGR